ncbi:MAG TPA: SRPBCC family protein, partial [Polyangia bacterium]
MTLESTPLRRSHLAKGATPAELYAVVTDFEAYPRLFREMKSVRVVEREGNRVRVEFKLEMVVAI